MNFRLTGSVVILSVHRISDHVFECLSSHLMCQSFLILLTIQNVSLISALPLLQFSRSFFLFFRQLNSRYPTSFISQVFS